MTKILGKAIAVYGVLCVSIFLNNAYGVNPEHYEHQDTQIRIDVPATPAVLRGVMLSRGGQDKPKIPLPAPVPPISSEHIAQSMEQLASQDQIKRAQAMTTLTGFLFEPITEIQRAYLCNALCEMQADPSAFVRGALVECLTTILRAQKAGNQYTVCLGALLARLSDLHVEVRTHAVQGVGTLMLVQSQTRRESQLLPYLVAAADDIDPKVRQVAVAYLAEWVRLVYGRHEDKKIVEGLAGVFLYKVNPERECDVQTRKAAAVGLGYLLYEGTLPEKTKEMLNALLSGIDPCQEENPEVRKITAILLVKIFRDQTLAQTPWAAFFNAKMYTCLFNPQMNTMLVACINQWYASEARLEIRPKGIYISCRDGVYELEYTIGQSMIIRHIALDRKEILSYDQGKKQLQREEIFWQGSQREHVYDNIWQGLWASAEQQRQVCASSFVEQLDQMDTFARDMQWAQCKAILSDPSCPLSSKQSIFEKVLPSWYMDRLTLDRQRNVMIDCAEWYALNATQKEIQEAAATFLVQCTYPLCLVTDDTSASFYVQQKILNMIAHAQCPLQIQQAAAALFVSSTDMGSKKKYRGIVNAIGILKPCDLIQLTRMTSQDAYSDHAHTLREIEVLCNEYSALIGHAELSDKEKVKASGTHPVRRQLEEALIAAKKQIYLKGLISYTMQHQKYTTESLGLYPEEAYPLLLENIKASQTYDQVQFASSMLRFFLASREEGWYDGMKHQQFICAISSVWEQGLESMRPALWRAAADIDAFAGKQMQWDFNEAGIVRIKYAHEVFVCDLWKQGKLFVHDAAENKKIFVFDPGTRAWIRAGE